MTFFRYVSRLLYSIKHSTFLNPGEGFEIGYIYIYIGYIYIYIYREIVGYRIPDKTLLLVFQNIVHTKKYIS